MRILAHLTSGLPGRTGRHTLAPVHGVTHVTSDDKHGAPKRGYEPDRSLVDSAYTEGERTSRFCPDHGDGRAEGGPAMRTPGVTCKRAAAGFGRCVQSSGGTLRSHSERRKGKTL